MSKKSVPGDGTHGHGSKGLAFAEERRTVREVLGAARSLIGRRA